MRRMFNPNTGVTLCIRINHGTQIGAIDRLSDPDRLIGEIADGGQIRLSSIQESCLAITTSSRFVSDVAAAVERGAKAVITHLVCRCVTLASARLNSVTNFREVLERVLCRAVSDGVEPGEVS